MSNHVLLLRAPTAEPKSDEYHQHLSNAGYQPHSISPLGTKLLNIGELAAKLSQRSLDNRKQRVIFTSSRSVDVWKAALLDPAFDEAAYIANWKQATFYVVGAKTAKSLAEITPNYLRPDEASTKGAKEAGTAEKLAHFILSDCKGEEDVQLLYLRGDKNRDTLPSILASAADRIKLTTLKVYETCEAPLLSESIRKYAANVGKDGLFMAFFAPSSSSYALPHLRQHFMLRSASEGSGAVSKDTATPMAIGPTTAVYLRDEANLFLEIVAEKPDPQSLVQAIRRYEGASHLPGIISEPPIDQLVVYSSPEAMNQP